MAGFETPGIVCRVKGLRASLDVKKGRARLLSANELPTPAQLAEVHWQLKWGTK